MCKVKRRKEESKQRVKASYMLTYFVMVLLFCYDFSFSVKRLSNLKLGKQFHRRLYLETIIRFQIMS